MRSILLPTAIVIAMLVSNSGAETSPVTSAKKSKTPIQALVRHVLANGRDETLWPTVYDDLGLAAAKIEKRMVLSTQKGAVEIGRGISIVFASTDTRTTPLALVWDQSSAATVDGKRRYESWCFRTDLRGELQSAAHGGGDETNINFSLVSIDSAVKKRFTELRDSIASAQATLTKE